MTRSVLFPVPPNPNEWIESYLARVAQANDLADARVLLEGAGISGPIIRGRALPDDELERLARACGADALQLRSIVPRYEASENSIQIGGLEFSISAVHWQARRVSPEALKRSPHHRAVWTHRDLRFCPETWQALLVRCPDCDGALLWSPYAPTHCQCGFDLRWATARKVSDKRRSSLAYPAQLIGPDCGLRDSALGDTPAAFRRFGAGPLFEFAALIGKATLTGPSRSAQDPLAVGSEMLLGYPGSFERILGRKEQRAHKHPPFLADLTRRAGQSGLQTKTREAVRQLVREFALPENKAEQRKHFKVASLTEFARGLGVERAALSRALAMQVIPADKVGGGAKRKHYQVNEAIVQELKRDRVISVSVSVLAARLKLPQRILFELIELGDLQPFERGDSRAVYAGPHVGWESAERLQFNLERLITRSGQPETDRVALSHTLPALGPGPKPWSAIISLALHELLPDGLASCGPDGFALRNLSVSRDCADALLWGRLRLPKLSPKPPRGLGSSEAEEYLGCLPRDLAQLLKAQLVARDGDKVCPRSVEAFAARFVSSHEIAAKLGISRAESHGWAAQNGLRKHGRAIPFWRRADFELALRRQNEEFGLNPRFMGPPRPHVITARSLKIYSIEYGSPDPPLPNRLGLYIPHEEVTPGVLT